MSPEQAQRLRHDAAALAARAGEAIIVESDKEELEEALAALPDAQQQPAPPKCHLSIRAKVSPELWLDTVLLWD